MSGEGTFNEFSQGAQLGNQAFSLAQRAKEAGVNKDIAQQELKIRQAEEARKAQAAADEMKFQDAFTSGLEQRKQEVAKKDNVPAEQVKLTPDEVSSIFAQHVSKLPAAKAQQAVHALEIQNMQQQTLEEKRKANMELNAARNENIALKQEAANPQLPEGMVPGWNITPDKPPVYIGPKGEPHLPPAGMSIETKTDKEGNTTVTYTSGGGGKITNPNVPTAKVVSDAQERINAGAKVLDMASELGKVLTPENVGIKGFIRQDIINEKIAQVFPGAYVEGVTGPKALLTLFNEQATKAISADKRISDKDQARIMKALPKSGASESLPSALEKIDLFKKEIRTMMKEDASTLKIPIHPAAMSLDDIKEGYKNGSITKDKAAELINKYHSDSDVNKAINTQEAAPAKSAQPNNPVPLGPTMPTPLGPPAPKPSGPVPIGINRGHNPIMDWESPAVRAFLQSGEIMPSQPYPPPDYLR